MLMIESIEYNEEHMPKNSGAFRMLTSTDDTIVNCVDYCVEAALISHR